MQTFLPILFSNSPYPTFKVRWPFALHYKGLQKRSTFFKTIMVPPDALDYNKFCTNYFFPHLIFFLFLIYLLFPSGGVLLCKISRVMRLLIKHWKKKKTTCLQRGPSMKFVQKMKCLQYNPGYIYSTTQKKSLYLKIK
jgi:hypothetical protein